MISKFFAALVIAAAGLFAGLVAGVAAPASADCAQGFTSIPCTIADNVSQAPGQFAGAIRDAPGQITGQSCAQPTGGNASGNLSTCGLASITNLNGTGCPPDDKGKSTEPCGLTAAPGQFGDALAGLPGQFLQGAVQIGTAPAQVAGGLAAAPGQFIRAIQNGGTDPESE